MKTYIPCLLLSAVLVCQVVTSLECAQPSKHQELLAQAKGADRCAVVDLITDQTIPLEVKLELLAYVLEANLICRAYHIVHNLPYSDAIIDMCQHAAEEDESGALAYCLGEKLQINSWPCTERRFWSEYFLALAAERGYDPDRFFEDQNKNH